MNAGGRAGHLVVAVPGDLATVSGGYGYDRRIMTELVALCWHVEHLPLPAGFPLPSLADLAATADLFARVPDGCLALVDGLAYGAMPRIAELHASRLRLVALIHHPLALETGLEAERVKDLKASETRALGFARKVVTTSRATARLLERDYAVPEDRIVVALPGTERAEPPLVNKPGELSVLSVGSLTPRKDHATLVSALRLVADRPWRCRIVGSKQADAATASALQRQIDEAELADRIVLTGAVPDIAAEYRRADIFALASRFEGYGMAFAEAMAHGLPIVGCRGGAITDVVPPEAGDFVEPGDTEGFAALLSALLDEPARRCARAEASYRAGRALPDWPATGRVLSDLLESIP